jgi:putative ABC transport system permease protein
MRTYHKLGILTDYIYNQKMLKEFVSYFVLGLIILLFIVGVFATKNSYLVKLAYRNFSRRKLSTFLIILGSMIGAALISGSLIVNDSFETSTDTYIQEKIGDSAGLIYTRDGSAWDENQVNKLNSEFYKDFDGFLPMYYQRLTVRNIKDGLTTKVKNDVLVSSFDPSLAKIYDRDAAFQAIDFNISKDEVIISKSLSEQIGLNIGEEININIFDRFSLTLKIKSVVSDNGIIGFNAPLASHLGFSIGSVYLSPENVKDLQNLLTPNSTNKPYNSILVKKFEEYDRSLLENGIQAKLNDIDPNIIFEEFKSYYTDTVKTQSNGSNFGQILLIASSFSVVAGLILMINLYYMIALERKSELGIMRVLGMRKFDIVKLFSFEGFLYSFLSSFAGTIVGIGIGAVFLKIVTYIINDFFAKYDITSNIKLNVNIESMVYAFAGAWIITFLTTILSSFKIANLNIISSIRDLKSPNIKKLKMVTGTLGSLGLVLSIIALYYGVFKANDANLKAYFIYFGLLIFVWILGYFAHFRFSNRKVFSFISFFSLLLTFSVNYFDLFENAWRKGPYLFFVNAVVIIINLVVLIVFNVDLIVNLITGILRKVFRIRGASLLGFKYPGENKLRTSLTVIVFSIIIFIVSLISILRLQMNEVLGQFNYEFDAVVFDQLSKEDLKDYILSRKDDITGFESLQVLNFGIISYSNILYKDLPSFDPQAPSLYKSDSNVRESINTFESSFFDTTKIKSNKSIDELKDIFSKPTHFIILGENYSRDPHELNLRPDLKIGDKIKIKLSGNIEDEREVIALVEPNENASAIQLQSKLSANGSNGLFISRVDYQSLSKSKGIFLPTVYALQIDSNTPSSVIQDQLTNIFKSKNVSKITVTAVQRETNLVFVNQLIILIQGFMAFGLIVGMAGVAVVLIRSVNERRQQIGMLRSIGIKSSSIALMFIAESTLIAFLGIVIGFIAGIFSSYSFYVFSLVEQTNIPYKVPFQELGIIFVLVLLGSLVFSYFPARKASKMSPAEATKYID